MSQENVEIVKRAWKAHARRDNASAFQSYDPEVEIYGGLDGSVVYRGLDGVREFFRDWVSDFDDFRSDVEEWIDAGDSVIAAVRVSGRGKKSGIAVDSRDWHAWTLRDGKMWRLRIYAERREALEAVRLEG